MLITWMAYAALFTALAAAGALALDRLAAIWGAPRRFGWIAAVVLSSGLPILAAVRHPAPVAAPLPMSAAALRTVPVGAPGNMPPADARSALPAARYDAVVSRRLVSRPTSARSWQLPPRWNRVAGYAWALASIICAAFAAWAFARLRRRRPLWQQVDHKGRAVWIAGDVGPAVVGVVSPRIVLPAWALAVGDAERDLMIRHEAEHIVAGDQRILLLGALALVAFPWNAALWMIVRRLRLAVEIDCDRRVLRDIACPHEYGMLLLAVSARRCKPTPFTASLAGRRPFLERRILAMTTRRPSHPVLVSLPFAAIAVLATFVAAQTPQPAPLRPSAAAAVAAATAASATVSVAPAVAASASVAVAPAVVRSLSASVAPAVAATAPVSLVPAVAAVVRAAVALAIVPAKATEARSSVASPMQDAARIQPARGAVAPAVATGTQDRRVTVRWENAPVDSVLRAFAAFSGRTILSSKNVTGTITADVADQPWETALRQTMHANGYEVTVRSDGVILVDVAATPRTPPPTSARGSSIPIEVLRAWIQRYHPAIIDGDASVNAVTIIVDVDANYVRSVTEKVFDTNSPLQLGDLNPDDIANVEFIKGPAAAAEYGPAAAHGAVVLTTKKPAASGRTTGAMSDSAVTIFRRSLETSAQSLSVNPLLIVDGVVVPSPTPLETLHVEPTQIQTIEVLKLAPGRIGPNALRITVVTLRAGGV